jgi:hypothetical protein
LPVFWPLTHGRVAPASSSPSSLVHICPRGSYSSSLQLSSLDEDHTNDEITADMFTAFCRQNGLVPPASAAGASILYD